MSIKPYGFLVFLLILSLHLMAAPIIDLEGFATGAFSAGTEDGYNITATNGFVGGISGNPGNGFGTVLPSTTAVYTFALSAGGFFNFASIDLRDFTGGAAGGVQIRGFDGVTMVGVENFSPNNTYNTFSATTGPGLLAVNIDRLELEISSTGAGGEAADNIDLPLPAPEPTTYTILLAFVFGYFYYRK